MNATLHKFGFPNTLLYETAQWAILLRPQQATLGALVIAHKSDALAFGNLPAAAFAELAILVPRIEQALQRFRQYDKINYLMLMMVDPHVHMHVIPRYASPQNFEGLTFTDEAWPKIANLSTAPDIPEPVFQSLYTTLKSCFREEA